MSDQEFPDLSNEKLIAIDLETKDTDLLIKGPGWATNNGYVTGIAVGTRDKQWYFPIGHCLEETFGGGNMDKEKVISWFKPLAESSVDKVFHNASYDVGWLRTLGINVKGKIHDTLISSSLIDETRRSFSLDSITKELNMDGKDERKLRIAAERVGADPKKEMYKIPAPDVEEYAKKDVELTYKLYLHNLIELNKKDSSGKDLNNIYDLETRLLPCLVDMRANGVRVDLEGAEKVKKQLVTKEKELLQKIKEEAGMNVEIWAAASIAKAYDKKKILYPRTTKTDKPSFNKAFLKEDSSPLSKLILEAREMSKTNSTFIDGILRHQHKGRIHSEIYQMKSGEGAEAGTVTGRFSYANPNLQQIPARNDELRKVVRGLFIPEEGMHWGMFDYSQQEPRLVVHFAEQQNKANNSSYMDLNPKYQTTDFVRGYKKEKSKTDFHEMVSKIANVERGMAKTINLGLFYGMGKAKLTEQLGLEREDAEALFKQYHASVPFVKQLSNFATRRAEKNEYITTLLGRRCRFFGFVPLGWNAAGFYKTREEAEAAHPDSVYVDDETGEEIKREKNYKIAYAYKALNKLIQGSAADQTKKAMVDLYEQDGIIPHIQVHDELNISVENKEQALNIKTKMENAVELLVPSVVDYKLTKNWGESK